MPNERDERLREPLTMTAENEACMRQFAEQPETAQGVKWLFHEIDALRARLAPVSSVMSPDEATSDETLAATYYDTPTGFEVSGKRLWRAWEEIKALRTALAEAEGADRERLDWIDTSGVDIYVEPAAAFPDNRIRIWDDRYNDQGPIGAIGSGATIREAIDAARKTLDSPEYQADVHADPPDKRRAASPAVDEEKR